MKRFQEEALERTNFYRNKHSAEPLVLDENLCAFAQEWAEKLAKSGKMQHRQPNKFGENLFYAYARPPPVQVSASKAVDDWYNEIKDYPGYGGEPKTSKMIGHFTQVVWISSKRMGIGYALSADKTSVYVVANYDPPGNFIGRYAQNVLPPK